MYDMIGFHQENILSATHVATCALYMSSPP